VIYPRQGFTGLIDLASAALGGRAVGNERHFFAPMSNLRRAPDAAVSWTGKFTDRGKLLTAA